MMRYGQFISILLAIVLMGGCASLHVQDTPFPNQATTIDDMNKARVYVIRNPWLINIASYTIPVEVYDGSKKIGIIDRRGYLCWEREPGDTTISTKPGPRLEAGSITLTLQQGTVYYILEQTVPTGPFSWSSLRTTLSLVDNMTGQDELAKAKPPAIKD